jgi:hypothetical protein
LIEKTSVVLMEDEGEVFLRSFIFTNECNTLLHASSGKLDRILMCSYDSSTGEEEAGEEAGLKARRITAWIVTS